MPRLGRGGPGPDDDDVVTGIVIMRKGENPSVVLKGVKDKIAQLNARRLPPGVQIVPFYDRTWLMDKTLTTVFRNLVEGALLVSLVLYIFLSNLRASLAVVVVIPLSLLATFMGLKVMGVPANLLSLGAMDFGIIVDGAGDRGREHHAPPIRARRGHGRARPARDHHRGRQRGRPPHAVLDAHHHRGAHPHLRAAAP
ncbi:CzcA family heavy metal efflux protein [Alicycliphilus sp. B1]|nr:CzcA family heavy metal efflux protein [Alicycliphilus sp. B1]